MTSVALTFLSFSSSAPFDCNACSFCGLRSVTTLRLAADFLLESFFVLLTRQAAKVIGPLDDHERIKRVVVDCMEFLLSLIFAYSEKNLSGNNV